MLLRRICPEFLRIIYFTIYYTSSFKENANTISKLHFINDI